MGTDFWIVIKWWIALFLIGTASFPLTKKLFSSWYDKGYLFAKAVGMAFITYIVYITAMTHILPFTFESIVMAMITVFFFGLLVHVFTRMETGERGDWHISMLLKSPKNYMRRNKDTVHLVGILIIEELLFFGLLLFWSWVKGHEPSIHGLEKFMDYGFMQSILNSKYFPAADIWYAGYPINYYYFGHTVVAVLTKFSNISLVYTFNLMLATLFALCVTQSFSIGVHVLQRGMPKLRTGLIIVGALLIAFLVSLGGNMQTIYAFTKGYTGENVQPFWHILWAPGEFIEKMPEGLERYWYANATRFIPYTIHEFPSYSFVVSDVHGHVMSIPFVLLALALLLALFLPNGATHADRKLEDDTQSLRYVLYGLLVSILLMTNALDGPIYLGLFLVMYSVFHWEYLRAVGKHWKYIVMTAGSVCIAAVLGSIPFMSKFSSFVSGVALNCPPAFLANQKIGPLIFEEIEKCQRSPVWMMWLLWGFFIYAGVFLFTWYARHHIHRKAEVKNHTLVLVFAVFFVISIALIIFPEFFYFKDIYPQHFRSNTMFKLGYQAFIMFSIISGYSIVYAVDAISRNLSDKKKYFVWLFIILLIPQLFLVSIYPIFSVRSYFDSLRTYKGLDGVKWIAEQYPDDYAGIVWLKSQLSVDMQRTHDLPVIIEADGDSYTDHARFSAFTGLPTVIGWPVHEWLWRGSYDVVAPRREEVRVVYESDNIEDTWVILKKYNVKYIIVGGMEREKFKQLNFAKLEEIGRQVFTYGELTIYEISN